MRDDASVERIAREALSVDEGEARAVFVDAACAGDESLRSRVEARLRELGGGKRRRVGEEAAASGPSYNSGHASGSPVV